MKKMEIYVDRFVQAIHADCFLVWEKRGGENPWPKLEPRYRKIVLLMAEHFEAQKDFYLPMSEDIIRESLYFWKHGNMDIKSTIICDFVSSLYDDFERGHGQYVENRRVQTLMLLRFNGVEAVLRHVYSYLPVFSVYLT